MTATDFRHSLADPSLARLRRWSNHFQFWLVLAFLVRLIGITEAPLETSHHWRQTLVTMVARNFVEVEFDLMHPRMDTAGELTGITGMEFPLLNGVLALFLHLFGPAHWYGRLIVLLVATMGVFAFHRLLARRCDERTAFYSGALLIASLWFMYSRKIMPDVFGLSLVIMGIERCDAVLRSPLRWGPLILGAILISVGMLSKPSALCLLAAWPVLIASSNNIRRNGVWTSAVIAAACVPSFWWYGHWVPHLVERYGYSHFFMGKSMLLGAQQLWTDLGHALDNFYFDAMRFSGFALFAVGCFVVVWRRKWGVLSAFLLMSSAFLLFMFKSGDNFCMHAYYVLPFVPVMAMMGGHAFAVIKAPRWAAFVLIIVVSEGVANQANDFHVNTLQAPLLHLETDLDATGSLRSLIAVNSEQDPTPMYFAHRRGWTMTNKELTRYGVLDSLVALGCERVVVMKKTYEGDLPIPWPVLLEKDAYRIHGRP